MRDKHVVHTIQRPHQVEFSVMNVSPFFCLFRVVVPGHDVELQDELKTHVDALVATINTSNALLTK